MGSLSLYVKMKEVTRAKPQLLVRVDGAQATPDFFFLSLIVSLWSPVLFTKINNIALFSTSSFPSPPIPFHALPSPPLLPSSPLHCSLAQFPLGHRLPGSAELRHHDLAVLEVGGVRIGAEEAAVEGHARLRDGEPLQQRRAIEHVIELDVSVRHAARPVEEVGPANPGRDAACGERGKGMRV